MRKLLYTNIMILIYLFTMITNCYADAYPVAKIGLPQGASNYLNFNDTGHFYSDSHDPDDGEGQDEGITAWSWMIQDDHNEDVYDDDGIGGSSTLNWLFEDAGKYHVYLWVKDNDTDIWSSPDEMIVYVNEVITPFWIYNPYEDSWDTSYGPLYVPFDGFVFVCANGNPDNSGNTFFPSGSPIWSISPGASPTSPNLFQIPSGYCDGPSINDLVFVDGFPWPGTYTLTAKAGPNDIDGESIDIVAVRPKLKEVHFNSSNPNMTTIYKDNMTGYYGAPHWLDSDLDGNPEREYPISYIRNTYMNVQTAKWYIDLPDGFNVKITAEGPGGMNFQVKSTTVSSNEIVISDISCTSPFPNEVCYYNPMEINWKFSFDNGHSWYDAGTSRNQTYITLGDPDTTLLHNLVHLSCMYADGEENINDCVSEIWDAFSNCEIELIDETLLTYWGSPYTSNDTQQLLVNGYGDCEAWSHFFIDILKVHGIGGATMVEVQESTDPTNIWLLIKEWNFIDDGVLSPADFAYVIGVDVSDAPGVEGQGNINDPPSKFQTHCIVKYSGKYYDPSYGKGPYDNQPAWENDSLAGLRKYGLYNGLTHELVKKNDPETTETTFSEQEE